MITPTGPNGTSQIIQRLYLVRETGQGQWVACCPAHEDKNASLSIRETEDGRTLMHCFAGCETQDVLDALGMQFSDLFPKPIEHRARPEKRPFDAHQVLHAVAGEIVAVAIFADSIGDGGQPSLEDRKRLSKASERLHRVLDLIGELPISDELRRIRRQEAA